MIRKCVVFVIFSFLALGCSSGSTPGNGDQDITESDISTDVTQDTEITEGSDVIPKPWTMDFSFATSQGEKGSGQAQVTLTPDDEPQAYRGSPGFQTDITVIATGLELNQKLYLIVSGNEYPQQASLQQDTGDQMKAVFTNVTLPSNATGYNVRVEARDAKGVIASAEKRLILDLGTCGVDVLPKTSQCLLVDRDPDTPGVQATFIVSNPDKSCDLAVLTITLPNGQPVSKQVKLDPNGQAQFVLTVSPRDVVNDFKIDVKAEVQDTTDTTRNSAPLKLVYTVDTQDPVVTITKPQKTTLTLLDDEDNDPTNGLNISVDGTVQGSNGQPVALKINDQDYATAALTNNAFTFNPVFTQDGAYALKVIARDTCGREGFATKDISVHITKSNYIIVSPRQGDVLLAKDDKDLSTPLIYDTDFTVSFDKLTVPVQLMVYCQNATIGSPPALVGQSDPIVTVPQDGKIVISDVRLDENGFGNDVQCYVLDNAPNPGSSAPIRFTIGIPGPMLNVIAPANNAYVTAGMLHLVLESSFAEGKIPHITVKEHDSGIVVIDRDAPSALGAYGATYEIPLLNQGGTVLADGVYDLSVDVIDKFGNKASDNTKGLTSVSFKLDTTAPTVGISAPTQDIDPALLPDSDAGKPGFQATVHVKVLAGGGAGTRVCLTVNDDAKACADAQNNEVDFASVTLVPGINELRAWAIDAAGNTGPEVILGTFLHLDAPRVTIVDPVKNGPVGATPFTIKVLVQDQKQFPRKGLTVALLQNGTKLDENLSGPNGFVVFQVNKLTTNKAGDVFIASATDGAKVGYSAPMNLYLKQDKPGISFVGITDNGYINAKSALCQPIPGDCNGVIQVTTQAVEDGSEASLKWDCGAGEQTAGCTIVNNGCAFTGMVLPNNTACQFTATVTDAANMTATTGAITVNIDRTPPVITGFVQPSMSYLLANMDQDPNKTGFQFQVVVNVAGIEAGQQVFLDVGAVGGASQQYTADIQTAIPQNSATSIDFGQVDLPAGSVKLVARAMDKAGNEVSLFKNIYVQINAPFVRIVNLQFKACTKDTDCASGLCLDRGGNSACANGWGIQANTLIYIQYSNIAIAPDNVRVCTDAPGATGDACQATGFHAIYYATLSAASGQATLTPPIDNLPDGGQAIEVEAMRSNNQWIASYEDPMAQPTTRWLSVLVDKVAPQVTTMECTSDTLNPKGVLNQAETDADGKYEFHVQATERGSLTLYKAKDVVAATDPAFTGDGTYKIDLANGQYTVYAVVTDKTGNISTGLNATPPAPSLALSVDKTLPKLSFVWPTGAYIKHGDPTTVTVRSDAIGQDATLSVDGTDQETDAIDQSGTLTFSYNLSDGPHDLVVSVADAAGNDAKITAHVIVDTTLPSANIDQPAADPVNLTDGDDADNTAPGFQTPIVFSTSMDAVSYAIKAAVGCDSSWANCTDVIELVPRTQLTNPGGAEPQVMVTLPTSQYMKLVVDVKDAAGNEATAERQINLTLSQCHVDLVGIAPNGFIGNADCAHAGQDCDNTQHTFIVALSAACSAPDSVTLYKGTQAIDATDLGSAYIHIKVPVSHGEAFDVHAKAVFGNTQINSATTHVKVDLHDPVVTLSIQGVAPQPDGSYLLGLAQDLVQGDPDLQCNLVATIQDDNLQNGYINALERSVAGNTVAVQPESPGLPLQLTATDTTVTLSTVSLLDQAQNTLVLRVTDAAGNETDTTLVGNVDIIPPGTATITAQAINVRQPDVKLGWNAVGDNGSSGAGAATYEVRFSRQPIDSNTKFDNACKTDTLLKTGAVPGGIDTGQAVNFKVIGPDTRVFSDPCSFAPQTDPAKCTYYFAVRAIDAVGNKGDVSASQSVDLCMHHIKVIVGTDFSDKSSLWQMAYPIGDVNGDGLADVAVGGYASDMFCVIYGTKTPATVTLSNAGGSSYQCIKGSDIPGNGGALGSPIVGGDIDGDGVSDLAVGSGTNSSNPHKVYIFFGVKNAQLSTTPNVVISGFNFGTYGARLAMNGDFNGDGYMDLMVSSKADNKVYLIPGDPNWKKQSNLAIDLTNATDLSTYKVVVFQLIDTKSGVYYLPGMFLGYMKDINGDGKDEAVIGQYSSPGCYYIFKGRDTTTTQTLSVSTKWDGSGDQSNVIRALVDSDIPDQVLLDVDGMSNLGWTNTADLMFTDYLQTNSPLKRAFIFNGDFLAGKFGEDARINATSGPASGILTNANGTVVVGNFENFRIAGSFDGLANPGLLFTNGNANNANSNGYVYYRSNYAVDNSFGYGTFPVTNMAFRNPYDVNSNDFGRSSVGLGHVQVIGDFNGDGFYDIIVGRDKGYYQVILY